MERLELPHLNIDEYAKYIRWIINNDPARIRQLRKSDKKLLQRTFELLSAAETIIAEIIAYLKVHGEPGLEDPWSIRKVKELCVKGNKAFGAGPSRALFKSNNFLSILSVFIEEMNRKIHYFYIKLGGVDNGI